MERTTIPSFRYVSSQRLDTTTLVLIGNMGKLQRTDWKAILSELLFTFENRINLNKIEF